MNDFQQIAATVLGILLILVGLALVIFRKDSAASHVKLWNLEVNLSTPALVVLIAGCGLFALPMFVPHKAGSWNWPTAGGGATPAAGVEITQEEKEPNDNRAQANLLPFGATVTGAANLGELDFFRVDVPKDRRGDNRLVIRRSSSSGGLTVWVFDETERQIYTEFSSKITLSKVLPGASHYLIRLEAWSSRQGYELVIRSEDSAPAK